jgi:serine phosphatase RsbU (regulator of sigma subunit)/anti-sigma regulatory factor (Ser/Thr protein kinase)/anti-anti-sigma regulatory factor
MAEEFGPLGRRDAVLAGFEQSPDMVLVTEGPDHVLVACGQLLGSILLAGRDTFGQSIREIGSELVDQGFFELYDEVYRTGQRRTHDEWHVQLTGPGGEPIELYMSFAMAPWLDAEGQVLGVVARGNDVTVMVEARIAEQERRESAEGRYHDALAIVTSVQEALLPEGLPVVPGLDVAGRYLLAIDDAAAGGDWFDAVVRPNGHVALVVGDVVGYGVEASAVMGQLRAVLHGQLLGDVSLSTALAELDRFASAVPGADSATVAVVDLDPTDGDLDYVTAGHPPPLIVSGADSRFLQPSGAGPLATGSDFAPAHDRLALDDLVLLYSDGLVERPGVEISRGTVELADTAVRTAQNRALGHGSPRRSVERVCQQTLEVLTRRTGHADDITMLAAQLVPPVTPLSLRLDSAPGSVQQVRAAMADWLRALEVTSLDELVVQHALGEMVTNVVEHAYVDASPGARTMAVDAVLEPSGEVAVTVTDWGKWREPEAERAGGRGLAMAGGLADELSVHRSDNGTTVSMRHRLIRSATLLTARSSSDAGVSTQGAAPFSLQHRDGRVVLAGVVDAMAAEQLAAHFSRTRRGGGDGLEVDLSDVSHLGSAAVQVLHQLIRRQPYRVRLVAPPGSVAQHVLELVRLPYRGEGTDRV